MAQELPELGWCPFPSLYDEIAMNTHIDAETQSEPQECADGAHELDSGEFAATEYPFYIVPRPPVPGKTVWSVTAW